MQVPIIWECGCPDTIPSPSEFDPEGNFAADYAADPCPLELDGPCPTCGEVAWYELQELQAQKPQAKARGKSC